MTYHGLDVGYSTFRGYIQTIPQFQGYFDGKKRTLSTKGKICFETDQEEQAQIDWKENINFLPKVIKVKYILKQNSLARI